jgi:MerR family copper efflux transcriptional regulator
MNMQAMTISKIAQATGVGVETIRFYERKGLIERPLKPLEGGYRIYSVETAQRIKFIRRAQEIGFALREIEELLSLRSDPTADCSDVRHKATEKLKQVDQKIIHLESMRIALQTVIDTCPGSGAIKACSIIEELLNNDQELNQS